MITIEVIQMNLNHITSKNTQWNNGNIKVTFIYLPIQAFAKIGSR